ncbi:MAG: hypothetical protein KJ622_03735 [Alphaproteobacteria bacterium]|nr:hypothetical protein [Alphaproteobacteria bacterium]
MDYIIYIFAAIGLINTILVLGATAVIAHGIYRDGRRKNELARSGG